MQTTVSSSSNPSDAGFLSLDQMHAHFQGHGYVILKGVLEPEVIEGARTAMNELVDGLADRLLAAGKIDDTLASEPFETRLARLYESHMNEAPKSFREELHLAALYPVFFHPKVLDVVETFLGSEIRLYPNYTARPKLPDHAGTVVLWHQDGGYTAGIGKDTSSDGTAEAEVDALRMVNVWASLVPARVLNGCMQFVPGTQHLGTVPHVEKEHYLEIAPEYLAPREGEAINVELDPGDVVLFHNLLFHRGLPNQSSTIRWSLDWRYQDATQPTLRRENGHMARNRQHPDGAVGNPEQWADLSFS